MKLYPVAALAVFLLPAVPAAAHSRHCRPIHHHRVAWHRPVAHHRCACRFVRRYHHRRPVDVEVTYYRPYPVYYAQPFYGPRFYGGPRFRHWEHGGFGHRDHGGFGHWGGGAFHGGARGERRWRR